MEKNITMYFTKENEVNQNYFRITSAEEINSILENNSFRFANTLSWKSVDKWETYFENWPLNTKIVNYVVKRFDSYAKTNKFKNIISDNAFSKANLEYFLQLMLKLIGLKYSYCVTPIIGHEYLEHYFGKQNKNVLIKFKVDFARYFSLLDSIQSKMMITSIDATVDFLFLIFLKLIILIILMKSLILTKENYLT